MRTRKEIGAVFRAARESAGITRAAIAAGLKEIAPELERGETTIKALEDGRSGPSVEIYAAVADLIGLRFSVECGEMGERLLPKKLVNAAQLRDLALAVDDDDVELALKMLRRALDQKRMADHLRSAS